MKKKILFITLITIFLVINGYLIITKKMNKLKLYTKDYYYMNTYINIKIYSNQNANKILDEIDHIFNEYHQLTDRYNDYNNINNIYYIKNNNNDSEYIEIDKKLFDIIKYGKDMYTYSNGLLNINLGNVIDVWKEYRDNQSGIPTKQELLNSGSTNINDIVLKNNNLILNNHPNIDLGSVAKGYIVNIVGDYLKEKGFNNFLINAGGHVLLGDKYHSKLYQIAIRKPSNEFTENIILKLENNCISTSGSYERYYEYEGKMYHHIIDPETLFPANNMKSVTVITKDSALADILTTTLFLLPIEEGQKLIEKLDQVEALWYTLDNTIIKSKGIKNYE